jgi:CheY-like chemotaxis protein
MNNSILSRDSTPDAAPRPRVLLAEDEPVTRKLLARIIKEEGFEAVIANDGAEAREILQETAEFAGAIIDVQMPNVDGIELLRFMQTEERWRRIPAMMITSSMELSVRLQSLAHGSLIFLNKPINPKNFATLLRTLIQNSAKATH